MIEAPPKWKVWSPRSFTNPEIVSGFAYVDHGVLVFELEVPDATGAPYRYLAAAYAPGSWATITRVDPPGAS